MRRMKRRVAAFGSGAAIGTLGGLIGLGGAEFRLPVLMGGFRYNALEAVILNKAMSLVVVATALPFRAQIVPFSALVEHWTIIVNLLLGSIFGAWFGAGWATRLKTATLCRVIAALLIAVALILLFDHGSHGGGAALFDGPGLWISGIIAGLGVGVFASLLGVAGGELLIPIIVILYGLDMKLAGSQSLAISLPTMLTAFTRYSRDKSFVVISRNYSFIAVMAIGSVLGASLGGQLLGIVSSQVLLPALAAILFISAIKVWTHPCSP